MEFKINSVHTKNTMQNTNQVNYNSLMLCRPLLADNWQAWVPYLSQVHSIFDLIEITKIETVDYRDIKKIVESNIIGMSDRNKIKKERKLANNRRAAKNFRNRALSANKVSAQRINQLRKERDNLLRMKKTLQEEINHFTQLQTIDF